MTITGVQTVVEQNTIATDEIAQNSAEVAEAMAETAGLAQGNSIANQDVAEVAENIRGKIEQTVTSAQTLTQLAERLRQTATMFTLDADATPAGQGQPSASGAASEPQATTAQYNGNGHHQVTRAFN